MTRLRERAEAEIKRVDDILKEINKLKLKAEKGSDEQSLGEAIASLKRLKELKADTEWADKTLAQLQDKQEFIRDHLAVAKRSFEIGQHRIATNEAEKVLKTAPHNTEALRIVEECKAQRLKRKRRLALVAVSILSIGLISFISYRIWGYAQYRSYVTRSAEAFETEKWIEANDYCLKALQYYSSGKRAHQLLNEYAAPMEKLTGDARKETLFAKNAAGEAKAEVHAKPSHENAVKRESEADSFHKSREFGKALSAYMNATQQYKNAVNESREAAKTPKDMVLVPAGEFLMGSPSGEGRDDEHPQHRVYVDAFYMDKHEVTNAQYKRFCDVTGRSSPSDPGWGGSYSNYFTSCPNYPVVNVSWDDANAYAKWAGKRLPTEAEWEKAARGTDGSKYPWGNGEPDSGGQYRANYYVGDNGTSDGYRYTSPVGSFSSGQSPYGVYDMAGNVWEWCSDWYDSGYYGNSPSNNPKGPTNGSQRVIRGGSWINNGSNVRSANRSSDNPTSAGNDVGFRCCR